MPTYPLTFPAEPGLEDAQIKLVRATKVSQSPFTGATKKAETPFNLWSVSATVPIIGGDEAAARDWRAFILELHGQSGTFKLPVPGVTGPSTGYTGSEGLVNGASQLGGTVITDGWATSTLILNRGDFFMLGTELKMCMSPATTDGTGAVTITFEPVIATSPADNSTVTVFNPYSIMRMATDDIGWSLKSPVLHKFSFQAIEDF